MRKRMNLLLLSILVVVSAGCSGEDTTRLSRIGRLAAARAQAISGDTDGKLASGWKAACGVTDETSLAGRVSARLRWDKSLADSAIEVSAQGATVELKGKIDKADQKRRAVELAESTAGVEKVLDTLEGPSPE